MNDVTQILNAIELGDPSGSDKLLPLVYEELRKLAAARMAGERDDHTLQSTALVHEAYLRLVDKEQVQRWDSRGHFFSAAAEAMRRILIESARKNGSLKRGGGFQRVEVDADISQSLAAGPDHLIQVSEALDSLADEDSEAAELVKLRLFAGIPVTAAGKMLGMTERKAYQNWKFAEAWLTEWLAPPKQ